MISLTDKVALITGGGQGLGLATATQLHEAGAKVVLNYFPDDEGKCKVQAEDAAKQLGDRAIAIGADVRQRSDVTAMLDQVKEHFGAIDILVNNAAILRDRTLMKLTDDEWDAVLDTNLSAVFRVCQQVLPRMNDGGRIVSMASISGVVGFFGQANYASAKAGIIALTKVLSKEVAARGITVNAVAPGVVLTEMGKSIPESVRQQMLTQIPLRRFGEPREIANTILFLCSELASYITGQTIHVNGGWWA